MRCRLANHRLVTEMDAIEVTDGDRGIPDKIRQPRNVSEYAHCGSLGNYRKGSSQTNNPPGMAGNYLTSLSYGGWAPKALHYHQ